MDLIARHPYIKTEKIINQIEMTEIEHEREIALYAHKVTTEHREFPINMVTDLSYRDMGSKGGLLYLHTIQGIYSYVVRKSPKDFIHAYKQHFKY